MAEVKGPSQANELETRNTMEFVHLSLAQKELIKPLWQQLNQTHHQRSNHWKRLLRTGGAEITDDVHGIPIALELEKTPNQ